MSALKLHKGSLVFSTSPSEMIEVPLDCLHRSKLIQDLLDSTEDVEEAEVPVTPAALLLWTHHVRNHVSGGSTGQHPPAALDAGSSQHQPSGETSGADISDDPRSGLSIQDACLLIEAADVLIDEATKAACARTISAMMLHCSPHRLPPIIEAVADLPEHLQLAALSLTPLPHCLSHLPPSWHPLALRAHHPSIDTHATLALHRLPITSVHAALCAATTLPTMRALSLAGLTLPLDCAPCISLISALPSLTALNLHDIGLRPPSAVALAAVLTSLPRLQSLDLSSNYMSTPIMRCLAPALRRCTGMRSLNVWNALGPVHGDSDELEEIALAVAAMPNLTALAIGRYEDSTGTAADMKANPSAAGCSALVESLMHLYKLLDLQLKLFCGGCALDPAPDVFNGVAALTQLQRLHYAFPQLDLRPTSGALGRFTAQHTQLTSIQLDYLPGIDEEHVENAANSASGALRALPQLPRLQHLWLRVPIRRNHAVACKPCITLAKVLPQLTCLSQLHLLAAPVDAFGSVLVDPGAASVAAVIEAALGMPQLCVLHVPVAAANTAASGGELPTAVRALLTAAADTVLQVTVDLYVRENASDFEPPPLHAYVPLFPYVRTLDVWCDSQDSHLQPLVENVHELKGLRELMLEAVVGSMHDSPLTELLNRVSCLSSLAQLRYSVAADTPAMHDVDLGAFLSGLRALTDLTYLMFDFEQHSTRFEEGFLHACASLPRLQVLDLAMFFGMGEDWCRDMLKGLRLPVKELHVRYIYPPESRVHVDASVVLDSMRHLGHLRSLRLATEYDDPEALYATGDLPGFQVLW